jgi:hypothetical protein
MVAGFVEFRILFALNIGFRSQNSEFKKIIDTLYYDPSSVSFPIPQNPGTRKEDVFGRNFPEGMPLARVGQK